MNERWELTQYFGDKPKTIVVYRSFQQAVANMSRDAYKYVLELI